LTQSISYWSSSFHIPEIPSLNEDLQADCVVIGAGISGLTAAYLLLKEGLSVIVLDDGPIADGQTCRTTGHLAYFIDDRFSELERLFGKEGLREALQSHKDAIDTIENICKTENIACDFERLEGHLFNPPEMPENLLEKEFDSAHKAGFHEAVLQKSEFPFFDSAFVLTIPNQAQFHPLKYMRGLATSIQKLGGRIYQNAHVMDVAGGSTCSILTESRHKISSKTAIVATNTPINNRFVMHTKQAAYRTYVIAGPVLKNSVPKALYYDTLDPYHYVRIYSEDNQDVLIIGGEDHKTGQDNYPEKRWEKLEKWAVEHFPIIKKITCRWSGQIMEPVDSLAFIGKNPLEKNVYIITGDSGNGLTHGTLGGMICRDLILDRKSSYAHLYDPSRKKIGSAEEFVRENINVGAQYSEWLRPAEMHDINKIDPNKGAIIQKHFEKFAVYRDEDGNFHEFSAVCPHLGCIVNWNDAEKTWDCPCHGSRFECKGQVICGPAVSHLKKATIQTLT
jgi:glycine/D-amino acid oxidase-like deaminating enzyme/nitrite reductase/ring-hydroxylating ferredoxin subunit